MVYEKSAIAIANTAFGLSVLWLIIGTAFIALYRICYRRILSQNAVAPSSRAPAARTRGRTNTYQNAYVPGQAASNTNQAVLSTSQLDSTQPKKRKMVKPQQSKTSRTSNQKNKMSNKPN